MSDYSNRPSGGFNAEVFAQRWAELRRLAEEPWAPPLPVRIVTPNLYVHIRIVAAIVDAVFDFDCMGDPGPNYFEGAKAKP